MDEGVDKLINLANRSKNYTFWTLILTLIFWINAAVLQSSYTYYEVMPYVNVAEITINDKNQTVVNYHKTRLTYEICKNKNYTIIKKVKHSITNTLEIYCDATKTGLIVIFGNLGLLLGFMFIQLFVNLFGVKKTIIFIGFGFSIFIICSTFVKNIYLMYFMILLINFTGGCGANLAYMNFGELASKSNRSIGLALIMSTFDLCAIIIILLLKYLDSWKIPFYIVGCSNLLVSIAMYFILYENPRYYVKQKKLKEFIDVLSKIAKFNNSQRIFEGLVLKNFETENEKLLNYSIELFTTQEIEEYNEICSVVKKGFESSDESLKGKKYTILDVLKYKSNRNKFFFVTIIYIASGGIYYTISLNIKNLKGNIYTNGLIVSSIEAVFFFISGFLMNLKFLGRKGLILCNLSICLLVFIIVVSTNSTGTLLTVLSIIGRLAMSLVIATNYTYASETYSNKLMNSAMSWNLVFGSLSQMIFPYLVEKMNFRDLSIIFLVITTIAIGSILLLNETLGRPIITDIEEEMESEKLKRAENGNKEELLHSVAGTEISNK